tara:strand:+ start:16369 stop:17994 length:1626 start_codon:yes stop_codon:yes gene_type:complete
MQGSLNNVDAGTSAEEIAAISSANASSAPAPEVKPNPFAGQDFSAAADVNLSDVDLAAIQSDPNAVRLAGEAPVTGAQRRERMQRAIEIGAATEDGYDALGLPIQFSEDRSNQGVSANIALGNEEALGELVYNEATNSWVHSNRPLGVTPRDGVNVGASPGSSGPTAAEFANNAARAGGIDLGGFSATGPTSGQDLVGFNPGESVNDLSEQGLMNLEDAARANDLRDLADLREANLGDLASDRAGEEARRLESEATAGGLAGTLADRLNSDGQATPEQLAMIKAVADRQIEQSGSDINAQLQRTLSQLREESGGSRGLRFTDTPVFNQAQELGNEAGRLQAQSISQARGAQSAAELNLPMQQQQIDLQAGGLALQGQTLEQQLAQQAFNNRSMLFGQSTGFGLDLLNASPSAKNFSLGQQGLDNQSDQARRARQDAISGRQQQNVLGLITGAAAISDRNKKTDISEMSIPELAAAFNKLPISTWKYDKKHGLGTETHLGAMAQDLQEHLGIGDGKVISIVDQIGIMTAVGKLAAATISKES